MKKLVLFVLACSTFGCTWVKVTDEGKHVVLVKPAHVQNCKQIGMTTSEVKDKVGFLQRNKDKVLVELASLAKNEAANLGGDTIVAITRIYDGKQDFNIYNCR